MEIRINRIGRGGRHGSGNEIGGGGSNPPPSGGAITDITADSIAPLATFAQVNCAAAHGLTNGMRVTISGNSEASYNVTSLIAVTGLTTFEIAVEHTIDGNGGDWVLA